MNSVRMASRSFTFAGIQMLVGSNKVDNLSKAAALIDRAVQGHATVVALPECFNSPYGTQHFANYAESIPDGETSRFLSSIAKKHSIFLIGGTIPEADDGKLFNTCIVFGPDGSLKLKYRKMHLFDIDIPGKITFKESDVLSPGSDLATFDTPFCKIGIGICYDIRFPELGLLYSRLGCEMLVYPGAFNMTTGPKHWELLSRSRALDNQVFVAAVSPARVANADYVVWGNSTVSSPWGDVLKKTGADEDVLLVDIDLDVLNQVRQQIPVKSQRRDDLYDVVFKNVSR